LRARPEAAGEVAGALARGGIEVLLTASAPLRVSCLVPGARLDEAVRLLHLAYFSPESEEAP